MKMLTCLAVFLLAGCGGTQGSNAADIDNSAREIEAKADAELNDELNEIDAENPVNATE